MFVDSHCHLDQLDLTAYAGSLESALAAARMHGVTHCLCVGLGPNNAATLAIAEKHVAVSAAIGVHPTETMAVEPALNDLLPLAEQAKVVAIGETGLDYYRPAIDPVLQQTRFRGQIRLAREVHKPLIIHSRMAKADTLRILQEENAQTVGGVMHCFTEDWDMAQQAMDLGFYISFSGIVTFANAKNVQAVARQVPLTHLLIETDAPYLAPVPYRGKTNEPAYVRFVAEKIAQLHDVDIATVANITTGNFFRLFSSIQQ